MIRNFKLNNLRITLDQICTKIELQHSIEIESRIIPIYQTRKNYFGQQIQ